MERQKFDKDPKEKEFVEKLVTLNRTAKTVKGGRRMSFAALTVVGDQKGRVGYGFGKANDISEAIKKSDDRAKRNLVYMPMKNGTIPHEIIGKYKSSSVLLKPACSGTGIKAGGAVRAIMDAVGASDVISKSLGSSASVNVVRATFNAIRTLWMQKLLLPVVVRHLMSCGVKLWQRQRKLRLLLERVQSDRNLQ